MHPTYTLEMLSDGVASAFGDVASFAAFGGAASVFASFAAFGNVDA